MKTCLSNRFTLFNLRGHCCSIISRTTLLSFLTALGFVAEDLIAAQEQTSPVTTAYNWSPEETNVPLGEARGINPGRVVWTRDPLATKWPGRWKENTDQWWTDANTDQEKVDRMLSTALHSLTGTTSDEAAWVALFNHYYVTSKNQTQGGYKPGEIVAIKVNLNNSTGANKTDNQTDASPHVVLSMVRQLVRQAKVSPSDIIIYDARRFICPSILTKVWSEFKEVRFVQWNKVKESQPKNPGYGDHHGLETADWVDAITYSTNTYDQAKQIPRQVLQATYLVNMAILKAHSYPYNDMEDGDEGQTAVSLSGKNHFGSIRGTSELHAAINTGQYGTRAAYSPIVDLAASPNLGAKTILYMLDGLYCGRKWRSYPQHFPNPPFNNRVEPYENSDWPASILVSQDGVALDSVGLDILYSQTKNNVNPSTQHPRILIRENACDYLVEMADPQHAPSKTKYIQAGKPVSSLGVHEHWDNDNTRRYSRNISSTQGKGIELVYLSLDTGAQATIPAKTASPSWPVDKPCFPTQLPGKGLAQHDFFYAGEAKTQDMYIVSGGNVTWEFHGENTKGEISDAVLLPNHQVLFAHQFGVTLIDKNKKVLWHHDAPPNTEIHTAVPVGKERVLFVQNGDPAKVVVMNMTTGAIDREFTIPVKNPKKVHGHFRHARLTDAGTLLVAHMDLGKVAEYESTGKEVWSITPGIATWAAVRIKGGNTLICGSKMVREVDPKGTTVWEFSPADVPDYRFDSMQVAQRLQNGNTLINTWFNQWSEKFDSKKVPVQALEVTPDKKVVWALRSWEAPVNLGPSTIIQLMDTIGQDNATRFGDLD